MPTNLALIHNVFFTLHDGSEAAIGELTAACHKYLKDHPGVIYFAAGPLVPDLARPVNDRTFHVALTVAFASKADHDIYQTAPDHLEFIRLHKPSWATVRIFDSYDAPTV